MRERIARTFYRGAQVCLALGELFYPEAKRQAEEARAKAEEADDARFAEAFAARFGKPQVVTSQAPEVELAEAAEPGSRDLIFKSEGLPHMRAIKMLGPDADEVLFVDEVSGPRLVLRRPTGQRYGVGSKGKVLQ